MLCNMYCKDNYYSRKSLTLHAKYDLVMSDVKKRLLLFLESERIRTSHFEKTIGVSNGYVNSISKSMQPDVLERIAAAYPQLSIEWLMVGRGEMLKFEAAGGVRKVNGSKLMERTAAFLTVPVYDMDAAANLHSLQCGDDAGIVGEVSLRDVPRCYGVCYVRGRSMEPLLKSGEIVAFKTIGVDEANIVFGHVYIVAMRHDDEDFLVVKTVEKSEKGGGWVKLVSVNPDYAPLDVHLSEVRAMGEVKLSFTMRRICC